MRIEELNFSTRTYNCLKREGIDTVDQLEPLSDEDLMRIRSFGKKCLDEIRAKIPRDAGSVQKQEEPQPEPVAASIELITETAETPISVPKELSRAIRILKEEYEKTRNNSYIRSPVAWALYHAWRRIDSRPSTE